MGNRACARNRALIFLHNFASLSRRSPPTPRPSHPRISLKNSDSGSTPDTQRLWRVVTALNDCDCVTEAAEAEGVGAWIAERLRGGYAPEEIAILVRSTAQASRARAAAKAAGAKVVELDEKVEVTAGSISISPMHLAKGLEFRAVAVMACDDEVLPLQERVEAVTDESDLLEVYETEHLLFRSKQVERCGLMAEPLELFV